jgi:phage/plasmid-associated DNA primase
MILGHVSGDDRELLQKYAGQCLLNDNLTQRMLILEGLGGSSKGAFVQTLRGVIGARNTYELRADHLNGRFEVGRMLGRTLLIGADVEPEFLSGPGASHLKSLVGGDPMEGETKGTPRHIALYILLLA